MSDRGFRRLVRSQSLPITLACTLAAGLGGCSTFGSPAPAQWGSLKGSEVACSSDNEPTKVFASVQRVQPQSWTPEDDNEPFTAENVVVTPEPPEPPSPPAAAATPTPPTPESKIPPIEPQPQEKTIALLPTPPPPPPRPEPSPEVIAVCGAEDVACQDQVMAMLADPLHKWIGKSPTPEEDRSGVRILAFRVLAPVLACDDLRKGLRETEAAVAGIDMGASRLDANAGEKGSEWVQLLGRAVKLELQAEIRKRC